MSAHARDRRDKEKAARTAGKLIAECGTRLAIEAMAAALRARHPGYGPAERDALDIEEIARRWTDWSPDKPAPISGAADVVH